MPIIRIQKTKDFTIISNIALRDSELSLKAKGLWAIMMSCSDTYEFTIDGLVAMATDGRDAIRSGLKELENNGYLVRVEQRIDGKFFYDYVVYESPCGKNRIGKTDTVNPTQRNTNKEVLIDKKEKEILKKEKVKAPTLDEVTEYVRAKGYHFSPKDFFDYYDTANWHKADGKPVLNWKQCCVTWESKRTESRSNVTRRPIIDISDPNTYANDRDEKERLNKWD